MPAELEFGLFDWVDIAPGAAADELYDGRLRLLAEADRGGFAVYHLAEHHGTPLGMAPSPAVFVAAAARETARIRPLTANARRVPGTAPRAIRPSSSAGRTPPSRSTDSSAARALSSSSAPALARTGRLRGSSPIRPASESDA